MKVDSVILQPVMGFHFVLNKVTVTERTETELLCSVTIHMYVYCSLQTVEAIFDTASPAVRDQEKSKTFKRRSTALNVQKCILHQLLYQFRHMH